MAISELIDDRAETTSASDYLLPDIQKRKSPLAFGTGNFGISILTETFNGFAYFYYIDYLGLGMASAALVRTIFALWDVFDDPLMGFLSDRTRTRWGRRRPWLFTALPFMLIVFIGIFSVPAKFQSSPRLLFYMLALMLLYETLITVLGVNYSALFPELFQTLAERARVAVYNQTGNILGLLVGLVLSPLLFQAIGFSRMAILYALFGGCLYLASLFFNREGRISGDKPHSVVLQTLRSILVDRVFWQYALMMILTFFSTSLIPFALPFYVKYSLQAKSETISLLSGLALLASLLSMPVWSKLIKTWTLGRVFLTTASVSGIGMLGFGISPNLPYAAICAVVFGGALQGINVCNIVIRAGLITRNIDRTGNRNEASYYGLMNSALRMGGLLQSLAMFLVGMLFGYISGDQPGPQPDLAFRFLISFLPILSLCAAILIAIKCFSTCSSVQPDLQSNSAR